MTNLEIEQIRLVLMTKCIIIVYIISIPFKLWLQNRALKKINTLLEDSEEIIYKIEVITPIEIAFPLICGGILGDFILPFYLYKDIISLNKYDLFFYLVVLILCFVTYFIMLSKKDVLTNHRLLNQWAFDFLKNLGNDKNNQSALFRNMNLEYSEISNIKNIKYLWINLINIYTKKNEYIYIRSVKNIKKISTIIEKYINKDS